MSAYQPMRDYILVLRARLQRYRRLAETAFDRRTAAIVARCAEDLELEVKRLERRQGRSRSF